MEQQEFSDIAAGDTALADAAATTHRQIRMAMHMVMATPALKDANHDTVVAIAQIIATNLCASAR
jgi:hypothetical protein